MKHFILFTFLHIVLSVNAQELYINKNYKHFYSEVQEEAKKGNVVAIKEMGDIYNYGRQYMTTFTGSVDYKKAMDYYLLAASYGYPYAQLEISRMYYLGKGVESDNEKNIEWRDKAFANFKIYAEDGDVNAMEHLVHYYNGMENDKYKDYIKAFYWAFRALEAGNPSGASEIASLYKYGKGVEKNVSKTYIWYARFCIEAKKNNWPVDQYPDYKDLSNSGFSVANWDALAAFTYGLYIPHVSVNDDDGISNAVITSLNLLANRNDDILATVNSIKSSTQKVNSQPANTIKKLFEEAYNSSNSDPQTKYNKYIQVIQADPYNREGYKALAYNNLGALYESLGDLKNAKACYEYALQANPNYDKAKENLKNVKAKRRSQRWNSIGNVLGVVGQALGTMSGGQTNGTYNTYQGDGGSYGISSSGGYSGSSSGSSTCKRCQGSGRCSSMSGTANKYYCHGSGKCGYCNGSGIVRNLGQTITCTACNGRGKCKYCNGSGKCSDCGGTGKK